MSNDDDNSEYDEDSFDTESIEEISDNGTVSKMSGESSEEILQDSANTKSTHYSADKHSLKDEDSEVSSLNFENDETKDEKLMLEECISEKGEHEIDESFSEEEGDLELAEKLKSLKLELENNANYEKTETMSRNDAKRNETTNEDLSGSLFHIDYDVTSRTPTSFNSDDHAFHMDLYQNPGGSNRNNRRSRNAGRKSLSFTNERMREIERHNQILLRKILTQKIRKDTSSFPSTHTTSSAVNRKKQQRQIDLDNQILKKKIEAIALRRRRFV